MSDLIQSVLAYTRLTKEGEEFVTTDLNSHLEGVKNDLELQIKEKNATIKNSIAAGY
jgi:light-regulated signal transduction histidine kinase (bacteriophytochrome)